MAAIATAVFETSPETNPETNPETGSEAAEVIEVIPATQIEEDGLDELANR